MLAGGGFLSRAIIAVAVRIGQGPVAHRLGKHLRFARADVEIWLASRREAASRAGWAR